jgi:ketosteroid isomerase-like protein
MTGLPEDFAKFMQAREAAAQAYVRGDAAPLDCLATRTSPASFFGPRGGAQQGARDVFATYERDAKLFEPGSETHFEILHMAASDGIAYWVGFQHATVRMRGSTEQVAMHLRVSEVFRREADGWRLIHRHADALSSESK